MRINGQRLQGLFGESDYQVPKVEIKNSWHKNLSQLDVSIDSLRGFFYTGSLKEGTKSLIKNIHGPVLKPNKELLLTFKQTQSYFKEPTYYMGPKENFIIAINLAYHYRDVINYYDRKHSLYLKKAQSVGLSVSPISAEKGKLKTIDKYMQASRDLMYEDPEFQDTLTLYNGIKYYDEARVCRSYDLKKSKGLLKDAKKEFIELLKKKKEIPTVVTFLGIIEALLGRVESALKFLVHAADLVFNPRSIYSLMSKLFNVIRMKKAALFYKRRSKNGITRLKHSPQVDMNNVLSFRAA